MLRSLVGSEMCIRDRSTGARSDDIPNCSVMKHLASRVTLDILKQHFDMRLCDVARKFGCCTTLMKQHCRKLGVDKWPYRTTKKAAKRRNSLRKKFGARTWSKAESLLPVPLASLGQDCLQSLKQMEQVAEAAIGAKRRVPIWNKIKQRKTAGMAAPFERHLVSFLERHPECEVYNGQDRRGDEAERRVSDTEDPMEEPWGGDQAISCGSNQLLGFEEDFVGCDQEWRPLSMCSWPDSVSGDPLSEMEVLLDGELGLMDNSSSFSATAPACVGLFHQS
eukprot:TRINITY_DN2042_c0_g1_i4.p1 TRINITY_DN2042_c0_g1~~TRINITY_DN2042_c0_g1_i4.p1  ORF type:complete len:278 (-),score=68.98 TRINITY_DN2042_c0_g1_i4:316-1149(-)